MFLVTRELSFCYGHRLLNYAGKCRNLHGHNGIAEVTIGTDQLDHLGMVVDFFEIKRVIAQWIDETLDHRMILHREDPIVPLLLANNEAVTVMEENPTAENIAKFIFEYAASQGFSILEVKLWETPGCCAVYRKPELSRAASCLAHDFA